MVIIPETIDATGVEDVSQQLNDFFISVPDGSTIEFPRLGSFRCESTLLFISRNNLTIEGNSSTIFATTVGPAEGVNIPGRYRQHLRFTEGSNITIRKLHVRGVNPEGGITKPGYNAELEAQHGFEFRGTDGVELSEISVTDVFGDFVYLGRFMFQVPGQPYKEEGKEAWCSRVRIHNSFFARSGRMGIGITGARDVIIRDNNIGDIRWSTFSIEPSGRGWGARHVSYINNHIGKSRHLTFSAKGRGPIEYVDFIANVVIGDDLYIGIIPPSTERRSNFRILYNTATNRHGNPGGQVMRFVRCDGVEVIGNHQPMELNRGMALVGVEDCTNVVVRRNSTPDGTELKRV